MPTPRFFITGTDTGVGKTWFTAWLVRAWRAQGHNAAALKPISSGNRDDAILLREASADALSLDEINPIHFKEPAAPLIAARAEKHEIDFTALNASIQTLASRFSPLAVEGVGGWRVPLAKNYDVREWARDLGFPVVVVARPGLGTLNHTLLTVDSIRAAGLTCAAVILNAGLEEMPAESIPSPSQIERSVTADRRSPDFDLAGRTNRALLENILLLPVLDFEGGVHTAGEITGLLGGK